MRERLINSHRTGVLVAVCYCTIDRRVWSPEQIFWIEALHRFVVVGEQECQARESPTTTTTYDDQLAFQAQYIAFKVKLV